jgi:D-serine deaminase-like pyridoxal phosphate-dependent protein
MRSRQNIFREMAVIHDLPTPALLLDLDVLEGNLRRMQETARRLGVDLRPHVKTHKCVEIALGQKTLGARGITVSTVHEARVFADAGFDDITWAFPLVPSRLPEVIELADRIRLGVVFDSSDVLSLLDSADVPIRVWLKVDCGYGRAGIDPASDHAVELARRAFESSTLEFAGILSHSGHAYHARSEAHIAAIAASERDTMAAFAQQLRSAGIEVPAVSVGSTPSCTHVDSLEGVTEIRPGAYSLFDYAQATLGSCGLTDCAVTVAATVVSSHADRSIVDAGALALSLDPGPDHAAVPSFGRIFDSYKSGILKQNARLVSLSQEHGIVDRTLPCGTRVRILPNHCCLSVACFDRFHVVQGEEVVDTWTVHRGR